MATLLVNKQGVPLSGFGKSFYFSTTGSPKNSSVEGRPAVSAQIETPEDTATAGPTQIASWGTNNDFPNTANDIIKSVAVLNTGLKFIRNFTVGQGIFPCRVTGYYENGD